MAPNSTFCRVGRRRRAVPSALAIRARLAGRAAIAELHELPALVAPDVAEARLVERLQVEHYITFHDLRHTFASHWVMKGGDIFKLQKILGHRTIQIACEQFGLV